MRAVFAKAYLRIPNIHVQTVQFAPFWKRWWGVTVIDDQVIQIAALADRADENKFEEIFESLICSLEVHRTE